MTKIIYVEGNIGSGKSTLVSNLKKHYGNRDDILFLQEPVHLWEEIKDDNGKNMIEKFYGNQEKYSFAFQIMAYETRLALLKQALKNDKIKFIISERSIYTDRNIFARMLYSDNKMEKVEFEIYNHLFDNHSFEYNIDHVIYVRTSPETCHERVRIRNRKGEEIPLEYLKKCHEYHEKWLNENNRTTNFDLLQLDGCQDIYKNKNLLGEWISEIENLLI